MLRCCMLCHVAVEFMFMLDSFLCLMSLFMLVPSFVNLGMALDSIAFLCFVTRVIVGYGSVWWSQSLFFGVVGVVGVVVLPLLSLSIVCSYLLVKGTVFLEQIQVYNVG